MAVAIIPLAVLPLSTLSPFPLILPLPSAAESHHLGLPLDWYVLRIKTSRESQTCLQLASRGLLHFFLPTFTEQRRYLHWGHPYTITRPLFPGYCFIKFNPDGHQEGIQLRSLIESTPGVIGLLQISPGEYATVPDQIVQDLWRIATSGGTVIPHAIIQLGSQCRVRYGPLMGMEGTLLKHKGEWHVALNLHLLGRACSVVLDREAVTAC